MSIYRLLERGDVLPSSFLSAIQEFISTGVFNLKLDLANATTVQVAAGSASAQASIGIDGLWRYRTAAITAAVSGVAGTKDVFVVTSANSFSDSPAIDTDSTDYAWGLQVLAQGTTPTGSVGGHPIVAYRKIGELEWDGSSNVTALRQLVGFESATNVLTPTSPVASVTPLVAVGATGQTAPLVRARIGPGGSDVFSVDASGNVNSAGQYRVGGTQIALSNLSNGTTGSGTTVVLATSPTLGGTPTAPTAAVDTNTTQLATTAFVIGQGYAKTSSLGVFAPLASPAFSGVPTAPTAAVDTNTTQLATTAFVIGQASAAGDGTPAMDGTAARGTSTHYARADHVHPTDSSRAPLASPTFTGGIHLAAVAGVAIQAQQIAGNSVLQNLLLSGDTQPAFQVSGNGKLQWGAGGSTAPDLNLYRNTPTELKTDANFAAGGTINANENDANRVGIGNFGIASVVWGSTADTNLYRTGAGALKTDGSLLVGGNVGFYGVGPVARQTGWGTFTHSDGTAAVTRQTLATSYTTDQIVDVLSTIVSQLKNLGLLG